VKRVTDSAFQRLDVNEARRLFRLGHFHRLENALSNRDDSWALLELGRLAFFHHCDTDRARRYLSRALEAGCSSEERLLCHSLLDVVESSAGRYAHERIDPANFSTCQPHAVSEAIYFTAMAAWIRGEYAVGLSWLTYHKPNNEVLLARFLFLEGCLRASASQELLEQALLTEKALSLLDSYADEEPYLIATISETFAALVRELRFEPGVSRLKKLVATAELADGFQDAQFHVMRTLAWTHALDAQYSVALHFLEKASLASATPLMRAYLHLDYASIAVFTGSALHAKASFDIADDYLQRYGFDSRRDDAAVFPLAAQVAAETGASDRALEYCRMADDHSSDIFRHSNLGHGARFQALTSEAKALAYFPSDPKSAINHAMEAYDVFSKIGYEWRAGRMALFLHQVTRKAIWRERAIEHLSVYPQSPFHRMLSLGTTRRTLTAQQQRILQLLRRGYDTRQIASELNRSPDTIRVHLGRIHAFFGVKNRHELLARLSADVFDSSA
jgi:DNA-binding CsgD family transcriptional regulator